MSDSFNLASELAIYCDNVTGKTMTKVINAMSVSQLKTMVDGYYEGGFDAWAEAMLPKSSPTPTTDLAPKFAFSRELRTIIGRTFRLSHNEEIIALRVMHLTQDNDYTDDASRDDITQHNARVVFSTVFTHTTDGKVRLRETKQTVTMRILDSSLTPGTFRLIPAMTVRVPRPDFTAAEYAGQFSRIMDVNYWLDKGEQDRLCAQPGDDSWLDPRNRAKSLSPMGDNARYVRALDRIV